MAERVAAVLDVAPRPDVGRAELDALRAHVAAQDERIAALEAKSAARELRTRLARLLPGDAVLSSRLLPVLALAFPDDTPFQSDVLTDARDANVRLLVAGKSTKALGRLLVRLEGLAFGDLLLVDTGKKVNGRREWIVRRIVY